ncbi:hypothetical protein TWF694_004552 [Orbilia ellipsospora]|uniref:Uncharacterized protein n=1 Tax=Orbilia ellipsospora TaxID=2528407 RepID=A0AAV9WY31_9PEZI
MKVSTYILLFAAAATAIPTMPTNSDSTLVLRSDTLGGSPIHVNDLSARAQRKLQPKRPKPKGQPQRQRGGQRNRKSNSKPFFSRRTKGKFVAFRNTVFKEVKKEVTTRGGEMKKEVLDAAQHDGTKFLVNQIHSIFGNKEESTEDSGSTDDTGSTDGTNGSGSTDGTEEPATGSEGGETTPAEGETPPAEGQAPAEGQTPAEGQPAEAPAEGQVAQAPPAEGGSQAPMERRQAVNHSQVSPTVPRPTPAHPAAVHPTPVRPSTGAHSAPAHPNSAQPVPSGTKPTAQPSGPATAAKQNERQDLSPEVVKTEIVNELRTSKAVPDAMLVKIASLPATVIKSIFEMDESQYGPALEIALARAPKTFYNKMLGIHS